MDTILNSFNIKPIDQKLITSIVDRMEILKKTFGEKIVLLDFEELYNNLDVNQSKLIKKMLKINPAKFGVNLPRTVIPHKELNLTAICGQEYRQGKNTIKIPTQFLPENVFSAINKLNKKMKIDLGKKLLVESGYRSQAYQLLSFIYQLKINKFNLKKTLKIVALPGFSEHNSPNCPAIDFITFKRSPDHRNGLDFSKTPEYKWLIKNARNFGFHLSYKIGNPYKIKFEPWHWHFEG
ncbi:MAG TPA: D-alanyl-D-alanine carboxypeptidase family protein [Patescibacteria group bacterium]